MRLSSRKAARFLVRFVVLGAAAGTLAGYSAVAMRSSRALPAADVTGSTVEPQMSNRTAKADRLPVLIEATLTASDRPNFRLASVVPTTEFDRSGAAVTSAPQAMPLAEPEPVTSELVTEPEQTAIAAVPLPPKRPKHPLPPPPAPSTSLLDDTQISGLKGRLQLTSDQVEYWPAVETALRDIARTLLNEGRPKHAHAGKVNIDINSPEVQRLIWAAMPLLMRLREDQKREVRTLARVIGLEAVASQI